MFLKIIINDREEISDNLKNFLNFNHNGFEIITDTKNLQQKLEKLDLKCKSIEEIFFTDSPISIEIDNLVSNKIEDYKKIFDKITFRNYKIFPSIENQLIQSITFLSKIERCLEQETDIILIVEKFYIELLVIQQNFLNKNKNFEFLDSNSKRISNIEYFVQCQKIKKYPFQNFLFKNFLFKNLISIFTKNQIRKKLNLNQIKKNPLVGIFLTPSSDYVYEPALLIEKELQSKNFYYKIFSFDFETPNILESKKLALIDLSKETWLLSQLLQDSLEYKNFKNEIKNLVFNKNIESLKIDHFFNLIFNQLPLIISIMKISEMIFSTLNFKSILINSDGNKIGNSIISVSDICKIPSVTIPSLVISSTPIHKFLFHSQKICLYGDHARQILLNLGYDEKRLVLTGNPKYDYVKDSHTLLSRSTLSNVHTPSNQKIIVVGLSRWGKSDEFWMSELIKFCNMNNFTIIIKVHPIYKNSMKDLHFSKIKHIEEICSGMEFLITYDLDPSLLLQSCDLVISDHSNFLIEGILLGKKCLCVNFDNENLDFIKKSLLIPQIHFISDTNDLINSIQRRFLNNNEFIDFDKNLSSWALTFNYLNDGNAVNRIFKILTD